MKMFSDVLLTVDYDRTLTAPDSTIPERNLEAIRYFIHNGGTFTVNTGRSLPMTAVFQDIVPVNAPLLLYNGSAAYDPVEGRIVFADPIQLDLWKTMGEVMELFPDLLPEVQGLDAHYSLREDAMWDAFSAHNQCAYGHAQPGQDLGMFLKFSLYGQIRDVTVADLYSGTQEEIARMDAAEAMLRRRYGAFCEVFRPAARIIDVHAKGVSKAKAARALQHQLGKRLLVCVGDAGNDVAMLQSADYAFCPADGIIADQFPKVCPCAQGSVAEVILEKIPEILGIKP